MKYTEFMNKYLDEHYLCPNCHTHNFTSTLVGYVYDENHPEEYKDKNAVTCQICGWKGIRHNLIPKSEKTGFKICYHDQLYRVHNYNEDIYETKNGAKEMCEYLNKKYNKYKNVVEFYPYEIEYNN